MDDKELASNLRAQARYSYMPRLLKSAADALEAAEAELTDLRANPRDEYHTMDELYDYRLLYNALAFNAWAAARTFTVVKSWRHSDGELCFGGGWFIVTATLPTGIVSNHYKAEHWDLFQVDDVWYPPEYDGHTPQDAAERLRSIAAAPVSLEAPTPEEVQAAVAVITRTIGNDTSAWNVWNNINTDPAFVSAFQRLHTPSLEAVKAETTTEYRRVGLLGHLRIGAAVIFAEPPMPMVGYEIESREVTGWRPVKPEEADRA